MPDIDRKQLKLDAKAALKGNWGKSIVIFLIYFAISFALSGIINLVATPKTYFYDSMGRLIYSSHSPETSVILVILYLIMYVLIAPLIVGISSFFLKLSNYQPVKVSELFSKFDIFLKTAGLFLLMQLKIFLWSLLLIVPGIIASLNYSQAFYIMAQNPDVGIVEAIELSKQMMKGEKGKYFVLGLSFLGWTLLSVLTLGLLLLWLVPYMMTTYSNFYNIVSKKVSINSNTDNNTMDL